MRKSYFSGLLNYYRLIRVNNLLLIFITQLLVFLVLGKMQFALINILDTILLIFSTICVAAAGNIVNDIFDVKADQINKPGKVIIGEKVSVRQGWMLFGLYNVLGFLSAVFVSVTVSIIVLSVMLLLFFYSLVLKRLILIGNLLISFLCVLPILILLLLPYDFDLIWIVFYALFAFLITFIREIIKDAEDAAGDKFAGIITYPVKYGLERTKSFLIVLIITGLAFLAFFIFYSFYTDNFIHPVSLLVLSFIPMLYTISMINRSKNTSDLKKLSFILKLVMAGGVLSILFLSSFFS